MARSMPQIYFTPNLSRHTECPRSEIAAATVAELLDRYFEKWPDVRGFVLDDQGEVRKHIKVFVDGRNLLDRARLSDPLDGDSEVYVFQALSGG
ncbi:MAG TPA: MoaD/ThiS family protein [Gammaproteobacteria bacterium]